jgi:ParB/RepB/Spo0J family partition protein
MATAVPRIAMLKLAELFPSPNNPRKHFDEAQLKELGESLKAGQIEPIVVREQSHLADDEKVHKAYEILAGERRFRAAKLAGLTEIEAKIMVVDDQRALEITVVENLQRTDLHPLEEANGVASLLSKGWDIDTIARDLGKSPSWVALRAKLSQLSPKWRKEIDTAGGRYHRWPAAMLDLVARFPVSTQDEMLDNYDVEDAQSTKELQEAIDRDYLRTLKSAPFDLADATLVPKAGACTDCPKRTGCQQLLFKEAKDDRCTDGPCWNSKAAAVVKRKEEELKKAHPNLLKVDREHYRTETKGALGRSEFKEVKKSDPKAVPALVVNGAGQGSQIWIKKEANTGASYSSSAPREKLTEKERLEQKLRARREICVMVVRHLLRGCKELGKDEGKGDLFPQKLSEMGFGTVKRPERHVLMALVTALDLTNDWQTKVEPLEEETWENVKAHLKLSDDKLDERLWQRLVEQMCEHGRLSTDDEIAPICCLVGLDAVAIEKAVQDARPLPRTLAESFEEDGSPKKGVTAAKAKEVKPAPAKASSAKVTKPKVAKTKAAKKPTTKKIAKKAKKRGAA